MTKGDNVVNVGSNAYAKAATGLNMLRETIMGRKLFDYAFKQYASRWAFRHPTPADFFRTMEDASGVDLDWFWRGWYFGTENVDISIDSVKYYKLDARTTTNFQPQTFEPVAILENRKDSTLQYATDLDTSLRDFYYYNRDAEVVYRATDNYKNEQETIDSANTNTWINRNFYELTFSNNGGLVMPIILEWTFKDGTKQVERIPVGIWKLNEKQVTKVFIKDKEVASIRLDPFKETADINEENGMWPVKEMPNRFQLFKQAQAAGRGQSAGENAMQRAHGPRR